jgi:hypothetical protein
MDLQSSQIFSFGPLVPNPLTFSPRYWLFSSPVDNLSTSLPSYDVQITIIAPLSPKLNTRLGLQPGTVSDLSLRLATSSRIPPYHILRAVHKPLPYLKIMLSLASQLFRRITYQLHLNLQCLRPDKSVFQSGEVQMCLCTRCDVGTL